MIAFEISHNGQVLAVVGAHDSNTLGATLMACGDLDSSDGVHSVFMGCHAVLNGPSESPIIHRSWSVKRPSGQFDVGDTLSIRIIRTESPTPPTPPTEIPGPENEVSAPIAAPDVGPAKPFGNSSVSDGPTSAIKPLDMAIPTASDINVYDSLDERRACKNFLGKSLEQAKAMFRHRCHSFEEDMMWMGPVAFRYYVTAYIQHFYSDHSKRSDGALAWFYEVIRFWLDHNRREIVPIFGTLTEACQYILSHYEKFEVAHDIWGNLSEKFERLLLELRQPPEG